MTRKREVIEGPQPQGEDEEINWGVDTSGWGGSPTDVTVVVKNSDGDDVTSTVTTGSASVVGDVVTLPTIHSLTADEDYRVEIKFTSGGQVLEAWFMIVAEE